MTPDNNQTQPSPFQPLPPIKVKVGGVPRFASRNIEKRLKKTLQLIKQLDALPLDELKQRYDALRPQVTQVIQSVGGMKNLRHHKTRAKLAPIMLQAIAIAAVVARTQTGLTAHPNQIAAALALSDGALVEVGTGEGKTLAGVIATPALVLLGAVHVATANQYLADRDTLFAAKVYTPLGITTASVSQEAGDNNNRTSYLTDVIYSTAQQIGFDYLKDSIRGINTPNIQRPVVSALVDEADSLLIDEARTPLIISGGIPDQSALWKEVAQKVATLTAPEDVDIDEAEDGVSLTDTGLEKISALFNVNDIYEHAQIFYLTDAMLRAYFLMKKDKDYIVAEHPDTKQDAVLIVDAITGRVQPSRRFTEGLHEAIEAKEGTPPGRATQTLAQITIQALFRTYAHLCGMSGTLESSKEEIASAFKLDTIIIPPHFPSQRVNDEDLIYRRTTYKVKALVEDIKQRSEKGQPVLVGTGSVMESMELSTALNEAGLNHTVLNARFHEKEAEIIAQAGRPGAVTVATNMAGRGVDILLGGNPTSLARKQVEDFIATQKQKGDIVGPEELAALEELANKRWADVTKLDHAKVCAAGGLAVIGASRQVARRVDDQLRGRAGRQGEPGYSRFYLSVEDEIIQLWGGPKIGILVTHLSSEQGSPVKHKALNKATNRAQLLVEGKDADARKQLLKYESTVTAQRNAVMAWREAILTANSEQILTTHLTPAYQAVIEQALMQSPYPELKAYLIENNLGLSEPEFEAPTDLETDYSPEACAVRLNQILTNMTPAHLWPEDLEPVSPLYPNIPVTLLKANTKEEAGSILSDGATTTRLKKWEDLSDEMKDSILRHLLLEQIDRAWALQSTHLSSLMQIVSLRSSSSTAAEYVREASLAFDDMRLDAVQRFAQTISLVQVNITDTA